MLLLYYKLPIPKFIVIIFFHGTRAYELMKLKVFIDIWCFLFFFFIITGFQDFYAVIPLKKLSTVVQIRN